jgi:COMPASS component SWD2
MQLDQAVLQSFRIGQVFKEGEGRINSLDFHRTEDLLVSAADDDAIKVYNTQTGHVQKTLLSKKYGVANIAFTHDPNSVIYSSNKVRRPAGAPLLPAAGPHCNFSGTFTVD